MATSPSAMLRQSIPDVQQRLESSNWTNRVTVTDLMVQRLPSSNKVEFALRYDLPREDYAYVLSNTIEGLGTITTHKQWRKLEEIIPAWVYLIKELHLNETTSQIARLLENTNDTLKGFSLVMLNALEAREYDAAIARLLRSENSQFHREARDLLIRFQSKTVVPILITELAQSHYLPRYYALDALQKIADASAIPALARSTADLHEPNRSAALRALVAIFAKQQAETNVIPYARTVFQKSTDASVVCHALALLVNLGDTDAIPPVMERLISTNNFYPMDDALREVNPRIMVPAYMNALESPQIYTGDQARNDHIREYFILQLGRTKAQQAIPLLTKLSAKEHWYLRHFAIQALGEIGSGDAVLPLCELLKEKADGQYANIHEETAVALFKLRDRRARPGLQEYLAIPGLELGGLAFIFNYSIFPDVARKINSHRIQLEMRGSPTEVLSAASRETGIPINVKLPPTQALQSSPPPMKIPQGSPTGECLTLATTQLAKAYNTRFTYLIGDSEVFVVPNALLPETFLAIFDKLTISR